jgi:hypothetical protein
MGKKVVVITRLKTLLAQSYMAQALITFLGAVCMKMLWVKIGISKSADKKNARPIFGPGNN